MLCSERDWAKAEDSFDVMDSIMNYMALVHACRPWSYEGVHISNNKMMPDIYDPRPGVVEMPARR